jgi:hypothetical protein
MRALRSTIPRMHLIPALALLTLATLGQGLSAAALLHPAGSPCFVARPRARFQTEMSRINRS